MSQTGFRFVVAAVLSVVAISGPARAEDWPRFRGPTGQGISAEANVPLTWSATENVAWKTPIPGEGWSSPIVAGNRVYVTTATDEGASAHVLAIAADTGKVEWDVEVFKQKTERKETKNSYATPTPVTDGKAVYAVFGGGGIAAVSLDGKVLWTNQDHRFYSQHGLGASPVLHKDLLIIPFDASSDGEDKKVGWQKPWDKSFVLAVETATGKVRWKGMRGSSRIAHVTPQVIDVGGKPLLVSGAGDVVQGFDPDTGERLWTVRNEGEGVVPSVVIGGGLAFTASGFGNPAIRAVRLDPAARGEVTATHLVWEQRKAVPTMASFLFTQGLLFTVNDKGIAQCLEAATGKVLWTQRLEGVFSASPVLAAGRAYFLSESGETVVIEPTREFKELARNPLGEACQASPAVSNGRLFIRTQKHLFCIGK